MICVVRCTTHLLWGDAWMCTVRVTIGVEEWAPLDFPDRLDMSKRRWHMGRVGIFNIRATTL